MARKKDGTRQFYDIVNLTPTKIQHHSQTGRDATPVTRNSAVSDNSISRPGTDVKEKFSLKRSIEEVDKYNYGELLKKKDMPVTMLTEEIPYNINGKPDRAAIKRAGLDNARALNNPNNTDTQTFVYVKDIGKDILLGYPGLRHGLTRNIESTAKATMQIGDILQNAIAVNELKPRENTDGGYVLMGIGADNKGNYNPTRIIINNYEVQDIEPMGVVYAVKAKRAALFNTAGFTESSTPLLHGSSTITISAFLRVVKDNFADTLSQNVLDVTIQLSAAQ